VWLLAALPLLSLALMPTSGDFSSSASAETPFEVTQCSGLADINRAKSNEIFLAKNHLI